MRNAAIAAALPIIVAAAVLAFNLAQSGRQLAAALPATSLGIDSASVPSRAGDGAQSADEVRAAAAPSRLPEPVAPSLPEPETGEIMLPPELGDDPELRAAFEELLSDPDPEVRRDAQALMDTWLPD